ncbi:MAG: hypothetical protein R3E58_12710 [Phycisphaerae bacterium]
MCTLIGTSTNLVIDGMVRETGYLKPLTLFELSWVVCQPRLRVSYSC